VETTGVASGALMSGVPDSGLGVPSGRVLGAGRSSNATGILAANEGF
jgi:hypothetical protein